MAPASSPTQLAEHTWKAPCTTDEYSATETAPAAAEAGGWGAEEGGDGRRDDVLKRSVDDRKTSGDTIAHARAVISKLTLVCVECIAR